MTPDLINGLFEAFGALLVLNHCRAVVRDRAVAGVSIFSTAVFMLWGFWNLYFYPALDQWFSFAGGLLIVTANVFYVSLLVKFRNSSKVETA